MKLYLNKTSPYARLTLATVHETGLQERLQTVWAEPWNDPPELLAVNPLAKVPAFVTDEGTVLIESGCICDYLIALSGRSQLLPAPVAARVEVLHRLGLGRAVIDCAFGTVIQRRFNNGKDTELSQRWRRALPRAAGELDKLADTRVRAQTLDLGDLVVAIAFDYVDFRLPEVGWRAGAPRLAQWVDAVCARPSMQATRPQ